jgi:signal transduction histidine kinase
LIDAEQAMVEALSNLDNEVSGHRHARLADFIRNNQSAIIQEWIDFAQTRSPASEGMSKLALKDHIVDILKFVATDLESPQTPAEQFDKSRGMDAGDGSFRKSAAELHAALRLADGFDIDQMVSEYRALRASVIKQWVGHHRSLESTDLADLTRFNEAIDQAVTESVAHYTKTINNSRNLFLGILGHDLRNPIGAASMAAHWMKRSGTTDPKQAKLVSDLVRTTDRATRILDDLLDLARSSVGSDIPIEKSQTDMALLCHAIADELRSVNEEQTLTVVQEGDPNGLWDPASMGQVLSNLMGNAVQYSNGTRPVTVTISGNVDPLAPAVSVHNFGPAIPAESQTGNFPVVDTRPRVG